MPSTSTRASASMCLTAWNDPMGLPNCTRSLAYSTVMDSTRSAAPSISALASVAARSTSSSAASAPPREPGRRVVEFEDAQLARPVHGGHGRGASLAAQVDAVDGRRRRRPPPHRPRGRRPSAWSWPLRRTSAPAPVGATEIPSVGAKATQPTAAPSLNASRHSLVPASPRASAEHSAPSATTEGRKGAATRRRPISSQSTASSTMPRPRPPSSAGTSMASQPWSAMADHTPGS